MRLPYPAGVLIVVIRQGYARFRPPSSAVYWIPSAEKRDIEPRWGQRFLDDWSGIQKGSSESFGPREALKRSSREGSLLPKNQAYLRNISALGPR
jgi:hypothetical protein